MLLRLCVLRRAPAAPAVRRSCPTVIKQLMAAEDTDGRKILNVVGPSAHSRKATTLMYMANFLFFTTYGIMINWLYEGHVDLWYGVYGLDDGEDE